MKKTAIISGTIPVIVLASGLLFKMHRWEGAGLLLVSGLLIFVISLVIIAVYLAKIKSRYKTAYLGWAISTFIMITGIFFKINHYAGSEILQSVGTGLFILFTILFALKLLQTD